MRIILAIAFSIATVSGLYSFQATSAATSTPGAIHGNVLQSKTGEPVRRPSSSQAGSGARQGSGKAITIAEGDRHAVELTTVPEDK